MIEGIEKLWAQLGLWLSTHYRTALRVVGWRIALIFLMWAGASVVTFALYFVGPAEFLRPETHKGAVFAGWVAGLISFTVIGIAATFVSLVRPEQDSFSERARILFRGQSGLHIDFIVEKMKSLFAHYAERADVLISISSIHKGEQKVRLAEETNFVFRSYINDIVSTYQSELTETEITDPPEGGDPNRVCYFRINGKAFMGGSTFRQEFKQRFPVTIEPNSDARADIRIEYWVGFQELNNFEPARFTKLLNLRFENHLDEAVLVTIKRAGQGHEKLRLDIGETSTSLIFNNLRPGEEVYEFTVGPVQI